ncbi:MAG: fimbrillin family protein, partial [Tannerellaceae bacterium]|nr:fimbrillin family protein [Tannerellaceae bacterium]
MSVFASNAVGNWNTNATPGFMFNQTVTKNTGQWTYTPLKYWPASGNTLSFFAVTPVPSAS